MATIKKVRLNLEVPETMRGNLEDLQKRSGSTSLTEVIRRSVALFDLITDHTSKGGELILKNPDGSEEKLRIL